MHNRRLLFAIAVSCLVLGCAVSWSPLGSRLEEDVGLTTLFMLRGHRSPPKGICLVNIDDPSVRLLGLSDEFSKWSREIHGRLVTSLNRYGARVIVFDVFFTRGRRTAGDQGFARAIEQAGNVILFAELTRERTGDGAEIDTLIPPLPLFSQKALALAPFPLPKRPVQLHQSWLFKTSAGGVPTLPAAALQALVLPEFLPWYQFLAHKDPEGWGQLPPHPQQAIQQIGMTGFMQRLRTIAQRHPLWVEEWLAEQSTRTTFSKTAALSALLEMYRGKATRYINYYGPPGTLPTLTYFDILGGKVPEQRLRKQLAGAVVFVGAAKRTWSRQQDGFYTAFSHDGLDLSGVEIGATICANLVSRQAIQPLSPALHVLLLVLFALLCAWCCLVRPVLQVSLCGLLAVLAVGTAWWVFAQYALWLPVVVSLSCQLPLALAMGLGYRFFFTNRERQQLHQALALYLPEKVADSLVANLSAIRSEDQLVFATCLLTDAQRYTALSEKISPQELSQVLRQYFRFLFAPVEENEGTVCNVIGDSMLALWPAVEPRPEQRSLACRAAVEMLASVERFNIAHADTPLPTRIGLHYGSLLMGHIGSGRHYEYAPVGDIVNTSSRVEGLNKQLGTQILATGEVVAQLDDIPSRALGLFLFEGKSRPHAIHELLVSSEWTKKKEQVVQEFFPQGLWCIEQGRWQEAQQVFHHCLDLCPEDGPSRFYFHLCADWQEVPAGTVWPGFVQVGK